MPNVSVFDAAGQKGGRPRLSEAIFGITPNVPAMHLMVVSYLANQRQGTQSTLTRSEVSGGGKKPWRQKAPAVQGRARPALPSGRTAVFHMARSRVNTAFPSTRR